MSYPPEDQWRAHARNRVGFVEKFIPRDGVGAELGVYCGDFTRILLDVAMPARLHLVDLWELLGPSWEHWGIHGPDTCEALTRVRSLYADEIDRGQVQVHQADDLSWLASLPDDSLDWAYIDTSHTYEHCAKELPLAAAKVKPGGLICGDDWMTDPTHPHHGVLVAVTEFLEREPFELIYAGEDLQWAIGRTP